MIVANSLQAQPADIKVFLLAKGAQVQVEDGLVITKVILPYEMSFLYQVHQPITGVIIAKKNLVLDTFDQCSTEIQQYQGHFIQWLSSMSKAAASDDDTSKQTRCTICLDPLNRPFILECTHVYCHACLEKICNVVGNISNRKLSIACPYVGDNSKPCTKAPTVDEIQRLLPRTTFSDLLGVLFTKHIRRHPSEFGYCSTPDCTFIFRKQQPANPPLAQDAPQSISCTQCRVKICLQCGHQHTGITCSMYEQQSSIDQAALEELHTTNGFKTCPTCQMAIEKYTGCRHVECNICHSHICWVCGAAFETGKECQDHLGISCGGIFEDPVEDEVGNGDGWGLVGDWEVEEEEEDGFMEGWEDSLEDYWVEKEVAPTVPWGPQHDPEPANGLWMHHGVQGNVVW